MKKIPFIFCAGLVCFCYSCNNSPMAGSGAANSQAQKNLEANHTVVKAFETGDVSGLDSVISADFVDHTDQGDKKGVDSLKAMVNMMHNNFKDMKMETVKELTDSNYVMAWMHYTGTGDGVMMPAGPFDMDIIETTRFQDGKAVEHWAFGEMQDMSKMMRQQMQSMGNMNKPDTSKMKK
jgi:predicted SnoaL-like aldol condensation-catalyzing enzyme